MKIATWNVNSLRVRLDHVRDWLESERPDVLAMQETKTPDEEFPSADFSALGYHAAFAGQPTYNGVALVAREPLAETIRDLGGFEDPSRRVLGATVAGTRVLNLYVPNGQRVDSDKYRYKLRWLEALRDHLAQELDAHERVVVLGDFNIAPEDRDVHDPAAWAGKVLCSEPERVALRRVIDLGLVDVFRKFDQPEGSFSWWDYRAGAFRRNRGLRIDLILTSTVLGGACTACRVDRVPRGLERPSDHAPVIAEFEN